MSELIQLAENTYCIDFDSKVGVYVTQPGKAVLIDSSTADKAKSIISVLDERGLQLQYIINTHSHADHIGSNNALQEHYGCPVYACGSEVDFIKNPLYAACYLYGGHPYKIMRHGFLMAKPSRCTDISECRLPEGFAMQRLSGHAMDMTAFRTPDGVWFTGDIACREEILRKYPIAFMYDSGLYLESLKTAAEIEGELFVCAHADPVRDLKPLLELNKKVLEDVFSAIEQVCSEAPASFEEILRGTFEKFGLVLNFMLAANMGAAVRSHISYLVDTRRLKPSVENNIVKYSLIAG